jgi:hypothetical protein
MRRNISWESCRPDQESFHGMVVDMITPMIAPAAVRTARSSALRPARLARASLITPIVRANSSRALARISGTLMVSAVISPIWSRSAGL